MITNTITSPSSPVISVEDPLNKPFPKFDGFEHLPEQIDSLFEKADWEEWSVKSTAARFAELTYMAFAGANIVNPADVDEAVDNSERIKAFNGKYLDPAMVQDVRREASRFTEAIKDIVGRYADML